MNILIVDDNVTNRELLRAVLETEAHVVLEAADGVDALHLVARQPIDAVISDILMPNMDGYRLCYELRRSDKFRALPFIHYTSTYTSQTDQKLSELVGADKYLTKPVSAPVLLAALQEAVQKSAAAKPARQDNSDTSFIMKQYSEALVQKLEKKNTELEEVMTELHKAYAKLVEANETLEQRVEQRTLALRQTNRELTATLANVKELSGLLPICCYCKKIRDGQEYWHKLERYVSRHTNASFTHGVCPDCLERIVKPELEQMRAEEKQSNE
ncbi:MAG: response regulator [Verrucomicrobia bacterium]|nr:response regulator [Verrucomicrobiota bacterium]